MTRAEYEAKYGTPPPIQPVKSEPIQMTRAEYEAKYGTKPEASIESKEFKYNQPEDRKAKILKLQNEAAASAKESKKANSFGGMAANFGKAFVGNIASSEVGLGKTIGESLAARNTLPALSAAQQGQEDIKVNLIKRIRENKKNGKDTSRLEKAYNQLTGESLDVNKFIDENLSATKKSNLKVGGEIGGTALDVLTAGAYGKAVKGAQSFKVIPKKSSAVIKTATAISPELGKIASIAGGKGGAAKKVLGGAAIGYTSDVAQGLQGARGEDRTGKKALIPGLGTLTGVAIPAVAEGTNKVSSLMQKRATKAVNQFDDLVGKITQGKISDIPRAKKALSNIDFDGVKTYKDLTKALNDKATTLKTKLDEVLSTKKEKILLDNLKFDTKVGEEVVSHNYVDDAINQLEELYKKTNDPIGQAKINQLKNNAKTNGITIQEVNDLARLHGTEFSTKAFSKTGEPFTSVNAQSFENTRAGLKSTARNLFGNDIYEATDKEISNLIRTRDLVKKVEEGVNNLQQKIIERGLFEKLGRNVSSILNKITGGGIKGFVEQMIPRGQGYKTMNALDLEAILEKNLKKIQELIEKELPETQMIQKLEEFISGPSASTGASALGSLEAKKPINLSKSQVTNTKGDRTILNSKPITSNKTGTNNIPSAIENANSINNKLPSNTERGVPNKIPSQLDKVNLQKGSASKKFVVGAGGLVGAAALVAQLPSKEKYTASDTKISESTPQTLPAKPQAEVPIQATGSKKVDLPKNTVVQTKYKDQDLKITQSDLDILLPILYGEISNRPTEKKELEARVILGTALNRIREHSKRGTKRTLAQILSEKNQYQAYAGKQYNIYMAGKGGKKAEEIEAITKKLLAELGSQTFKDITNGASYYIHNKDESITFDDKKKLFR